MEDWQKAVGGTCYCFLVVLSIILISLSFSSLEPNEMGLDCNNNRKEVDTERLWQGGRHFLGLGHGFIKFPKNAQQSQIALNARSADGAEVSLTCSYQWQLIQTADSLTNMWLLFGDEDYPQVFDKVAKDEIRNTAAKFSAFDYFFERSNITNTMEFNLRSALTQIGAQVSSFQLLNFDVPREFSDTVTLTEETKQLRTQAVTQQQTASITVSQKVETAREDATILVVNAQAAAVAFVQSKEAERDAIVSRFSAEIDAYKAMKENLDLTADELLSFIWINSIKQSSASQVFNVPFPAALSASMGMNSDPVPVPEVPTTTMMPRTTTTTPPTTTVQPTTTTTVQPTTTTTAPAMPTTVPASTTAGTTVFN